MDFRLFGGFEFGSRSAEVYWVPVENIEKSAEKLDEFNEILRLELQRDVGIGEKTILEEALNEANEKISKWLETHNTKKIIVFIKKSLSSAHFGNNNKAWLHNNIEVVFGTEGN